MANAAKIEPIETDQTPEPGAVAVPDIIAISDDECLNNGLSELWARMDGIDRPQFRAVSAKDAFDALTNGTVAFAIVEKPSLSDLNIPKSLVRDEFTGLNGWTPVILYPKEAELPEITKEFLRAAKKADVEISKEKNMKMMQACVRYKDAFGSSRTDTPPAFKNSRF